VKFGTAVHHVSILQGLFILLCPQLIFSLCGTKTDLSVLNPEVGIIVSLV